jgi:hypothetical protein
MNGGTSPPGVQMSLKYSLIFQQNTWPAPRFDDFFCTGRNLSPGHPLLKRDKRLWIGSQACDLTGITWLAVYYYKIFIIREDIHTGSDSSPGPAAAGSGKCH